MGELREDAGPRPRPTPAATARPRPEPRPRPDPNPMRLMAGFVGLASISAIATGLLPSVVPSTTASAGGVSGADSGAATIVADAGPLPVKHVTRYVQLEPGQTAPPQAPVVAAPRPTPRVVVVTTTRQSGMP
jgi:hypothetical protein